MTRLMRPGMVVVFAVLAFLFSATAQYPQQQNWGTGQYPAQPACGYQNSIGDEATSLRDEVNQRTRELAGAKSDLRRLRGRQNSLRSSVAAQRDLFKLTGFDGPAFNQIEAHINSGASCNQYSGYCDFQSSGGYSSNESTDSSIESIQGETTLSRMPAADLGGYKAPIDEGDVPIEPEVDQDSNPPPNNRVTRPAPRPRPQRQRPQCVDGNQVITGGMAEGVFLSQCGPGPGEMRASVCDQIVEGSQPRGRNPSSCRKYLANWMERQRELRGMEFEMAELDAKILELEALTKASKVELAEAMNERQRNLREGLTEGGCLDCALNPGGGYGGGFQQAPQRSGLWDLAGGIIAAGVNAYSSYSLGKYVANQNAKIGFQTQQIPLTGHILSAGWPMISGGLYGAMGGGGGRGSFGCGGGPFGGGQQFGQNGFAGANGFAGPYGPNGAQGNVAFGFPQQMFGTPAGGGMFNVGLGAGFQPGYGAQAYCPVQPCPVNGQFGLGGQFGGGQFGGGQFGNGGFQQGGYNPFQPGMGTNLGFSAGAGFGGIPGYTGAGGFYGNGGMPYGGAPGAIPGYGASAGGAWAGTPQPFGGQSGGAGGQFGGQFGGPGGQFGGQFGGPGGAGGQFNNYQYQQQMAQAQAQQYALMAQQQQQQYQAQLAQQQTISNLYGEMHSLNARIQSAQTQYQSGGYLGFQSNFGPSYGSSSGQPMPSGPSASTPQPFPYQQQQQQPGGAVPAFSR